MIKCSFCGTENVENTLFCSECGTYLLEDNTQSTDALGGGQIAWVDEEEDAFDDIAPIKGTGPLTIRLRIGETGRKVEAPLTKAIHMGRLDPANNVFPEIDLSQEQGVEKGISRQHARIFKREGVVVVEDLGSINGTFVNGRRLAPYLPETLHHGDQLQLGKLSIEVELF